ncbi:DUF3500 domain-containing protein [Actinopolymorpha sp. NPDC004070]|uniref:DUF3500 domain-containing protein n=1 Tax=Actinopolymorpha sp. NPDC004070 TaxID=3154548 RepID=UPI0033BDA276
MPASQAATTARMVAAATAFLSALTPDQRTAATAPFDTDDHRVWTYLPGPRPGLALADMSEEQRGLAAALLATGLSDEGSGRARAIMTLDGILRGLEREAGSDMWKQRDAGYFWVRVLGDPAGSQPWAWRVNGHHLAVHFAVVGDEVASTPQFFGANPAKVLSGPHAGLRTLPESEDLGRALLASLDPDRRARAVVDAEAPDDILTRRDPVADAGRLPRGLAYADMTDPQRGHLETLVRHYLGRSTAEVAEASWHDVEKAGLERVTFSWAGSLRPGVGERHYYAVAGPTFVLEYDNTQNDANHIHTVWRDLRNDWGEDLLAAHYAQQHR